ncbi:MAG: hypothetical protein WCP68_19330 [Enhydrobacter sp.]
MSITRRAATLGGLGLVTSDVVGSSARAEGGLLTDLVAGTEEFGVAIEAYTYGYALVTMEMTRRVITNAAKPEGTHAPMGQFARLREYPSATFRDVTAPNADTQGVVHFIHS